MKKIIGLGELLWDLLPAGKALGGAPCNFAYHASNCDGCEGVAISAIGKDELGDEIQAVVADKKIKNIISAVEYPTGTVNVTLDNEGIPAYDICRNVAWDYIPFTPEMESLAKEADAACFGSLAQRSETSRNTIRAFLNAMPKDSLKVFDINLRQDYFSKELIEDSLKLSNILKINDDEVEVVRNLFGWNGESDEEVCRRLLKDYDLKMVVETCGAKESFVYYPNGTSHVLTPKVEVVDTVGAGDSFTGSFVGTLLSGKSIEEAHRKAVETAAFVCTQNGAMPEYK